MKRYVYLSCSFFNLLLIYLLFTISVLAQHKNQSVGQIGNVDLAGVALLSVPKGFVFMEGNSVRSPYQIECDSIKHLGCLVAVSPTSANNDDAPPFIIELIYVETGYIPDSVLLKTPEDFFWKDITQINYEKNQYIKAKGCDTLSIQSWAMKPYFLQEKHQLQWAVSCSSNNQNYVRYSTHKLGRYGVLEMNISTSPQHLLEVNSQIPLVTSSIDFYEGFKHEDFDPNFDNLAAFGFAGILAGKVLTKVKVVPFIFKWLKWLIIALLGVFTFFKRKLISKELDIDLENSLEISYLDTESENE
ncbi:DUF2167 domain-containing protein [Bernardetia sp.]|uniref:DUF2167 domain-containing protein n=1 Tax=Bernardetia sp. TaxID=1937974 RepID=UPI0025BBAD37|nr:DUF2167 domain-containing protein [Bernardetia sp.]